MKNKNDVINNIVNCLISNADATTESPAEWDESEKSVKIQLSDEQFERAKKLDFDVRWSFTFVEKK